MNVPSAVSFLVYLLCGEWRSFTSQAAARTWIESNAQDAELFDSAGGFFGMFLHRQGWVL